MKVRLFDLLVILGAAALLGGAMLAVLPGTPLPAALTNGVPAAAVFVTGAYAYIRRPGHRAARRLLLFGAALTVSLCLALLVAFAAREGAPTALLWPIAVLQHGIEAVALVAWVALFAVFPDGRYPAPYQRRAVAGFAVLAAIIYAGRLLAGPITVTFLDFGPTMPGPVTLGFMQPFLPLRGLVYLAPVLALALLVLRYRDAGPEERLQIRWPLFATVLAALFFALGALPVVNRAPQVVSDLLFVAVVTMLPISILIGMLRHRLLDIDLVIRRSIVFGVLWVGIALVYVLLSAGLGLFAAQRLSVGVAVVVTIFATLLFQPARTRLERLADRIAFGRRQNGYALIRSLGAVLEQAFDLEELAPRIGATVAEGLDAQWARVALEGAGPPPEPVVLEVPLALGDISVGRIQVGARRRGEYRLADRQLLEALAGQAALALQNARLAADLAERAAELQASRARIVRAEDSARRKLERDLHDGVQQHLVSLLAGLALARNRAERAGGADPGSLEQLSEQARVALADLRLLAQGIHPPVLSDRGLVAAVEALASRLPIGVVIDAPALEAERFSAEIEAAAYFLLSEGLTNVAKHAGVAEARVALRRWAGPCLRVEVADAGAGMNGSVEGVGLRGLRDRVEALGGEFEVGPGPDGHGVRLVALIPIVEGGE